MPHSTASLRSSWILESGQSTDIKITLPNPSRGNVESSKLLFPSIVAYCVLLGGLNRFPLIVKRELMKVSNAYSGNHSLTLWKLFLADWWAVDGSSSGCNLWTQTSPLEINKQTPLITQRMINDWLWRSNLSSNGVVLPRENMLMSMAVVRSFFLFYSHLKKLTARGLFPSFYFLIVKINESKRLALPFWPWDANHQSKQWVQVP